MLILLIFSMFSPFVSTASAQSVSPQVDLDCVSADPSGDVEIDVYPGATLTGTAYCVVSNPSIYTEKISITIDSNGLTYSEPSPIELGPGEEEEIQVGFFAEERAEVGRIEITIEAQVTHVNEVVNPVNTTSTQVLNVRIMQYAEIAIESLEPSIITLQTKVDYIVNFRIFNHGNGQDKLRFSIQNLDQLSVLGFQITLPVVSMEMLARDAPYTMIIQMRTPKDFNEWPVNSDGDHELEATIELTVTSDFSVRESYIVSESVFQKVIVFHEQSDTLFVSGSSSQYLLYGGGGGGLLILIVLLFVITRKRGQESSESW